jgi:dethiobiotin synthetase
MNAPAARRIIFITGTDTGVGKTLLTALLLCQLRAQGCHALAMKPFCSGGLGDVRLLQAAQDHELTAGEINPFYFKPPVAPLAAMREGVAAVRLPEVLRAISRMARRCEVLLVEGSGGLLVPLGEGYSVADLIAKLKCEVIVVSRNRLGTINHTLLTVRALQRIETSGISVVLMGAKRKDRSTRSNAALLGELLGGVPLHTISFLGDKNFRVSDVKKSCQKIEKSLAGILG